MSKKALETLQRDVETILLPLGYEVVSLEQAAGGKKIVLYIDFLKGSDEDTRKISLDDCVTVNRAVDELFEKTSLIEGSYTLEVSSPGIERPLTKVEHFQRFKGRKARVHTFRALEVQEVENPKYWDFHKKQKNFIGALEGISNEGKILMLVDGELIKIPNELISKAHLTYEAWEKK